MLTHLQIRDFAILEAVELEFGHGFTVLTGETGAGKSILVDALMLAVGGRADSGAVRHGSERAEMTLAWTTRRIEALAHSQRFSLDAHLRGILAVYRDVAPTAFEEPLVPALA